MSDVIDVALLRQSATDQPRSAAPTSSAHRVGPHAEVLAQVLQPHVNLSLWQRSPLPAMVRELAALDASLPDARCQTAPDSFASDVVGLLATHGLDSRLFERWRRDLSLVADMFFAMTAGRDVTLRLETINSDGCRRFHVDHSHLRLLCTYRGLGTQWLRNTQVDRVALATYKPNETIIRHGSPACFEPFWVGVMKGETYPGNRGRGLVHRSPPLSGANQTRVLFCLDC